MAAPLFDCLLPPIRFPLRPSAYASPRSSNPLSLVRLHAPRRAWIRFAFSKEHTVSLGADLRIAQIRTYAGVGLEAETKLSPENSAVDFALAKLPRNEVGSSGGTALPEPNLPWTMAWVRHHDRYGD